MECYTEWNIDLNISSFIQEESNQSRKQKSFRLRKLLTKKKTCIYKIKEKSLICSVYCLDSKMFYSNWLNTLQRIINLLVENFWRKLPQFFASISTCYTKVSVEDVQWMGLRRVRGKSSHLSNALYMELLAKTSHSSNTLRRIGSYEEY